MLKRRLSLVLTLVPLMACGQPADPGAPATAVDRPDVPAIAVYVTNETGGTISVVDAATNEIVRVIPVGKRPRGAAVSPDRQTLYVALSGSPIAGPGVDEDALPPPDRSADGIGVVDLVSQELVRVIPAGTDPELVAVSRDGATLFVANEDAATASVVDVATGNLVATYAVGGEPEGVGVEPDNGRVWVTSEEDGKAYVIDLDQEAVVAAIDIGARPRSVAFLDDGTRALLPAENDFTLAVVDTATLQVEKVIPLGEVFRAMGVAVAPDQRHVYVTGGRSRQVAIVDLETFSVVGTVEAGIRPWGIAVHPSGERLYTANGPSHDVSVIDLTTQSVVATIASEGSPWGVTVVSRPD